MRSYNPLKSDLSYTPFSYLTPKSHSELRNSKIAPQRIPEGMSSPQLDQVQSPLAHSERFMVKEESAASVGTRPWTPEGRSLILSIAFML
ncbi:hypothetical protein AVEN_195007-1 [Araneus ventricosus]|uniref:Uncharacterized protein n=1 Tax=Araneus ventricosus TaxID=182803 RepID=A0A4Y2HP39_ARAVE|nr:hypothetical protein AVEN_195007-1 [Araneus ventricosus]